MELRKNISSFVPQSSKAFTTALVCLMATALARSGGDPWKAKPYQQWDANDVKKVFNDSPWSKVVQITATWKSSGVGLAEEPGEPQNGSGLKQGTSAASGQSGGAPSQAGQVGSTPTGGEASFVVRWISSRTIREAGYRGSVIEGRLKEDEAEKQLAQPVGAYQVYFGGPDMTPFQSMDEKALQAAAILTGKKMKQRIGAAKAELVRSPDGKAVQGIIFSFPKQTDNGEPSISPTEKAVEFTCTVGKVKIQTSFDLSKMEDTQGRDI